MLTIQILRNLIGKHVKGTYERQTKATKRQKANLKKGMEENEFEGYVDDVTVHPSTGNTLMILRNMNRITPGDPKSVTLGQIKMREALKKLNPKAVTELPGEYQLRNYIMEGITSLYVRSGKFGNWKKVL